MKISQKTQQHKTTRKMKQNSPYPTHCKHGGRFRRSMKTCHIHQIARWYECSVCGACEALKRPAGPIASRSPTSFVFNDVVGLDLFFLNTSAKRTLPAMNMVCWCIDKQRVIPIRDQSGETLRNTYRNNWLRSYGRPRVLVVDQQRSLCSGIFAERVESGGTTLEVTQLEAPWRNGKTERAGKDWKEDYNKMTQDGPKAQTWTDSVEDCDAVNQARASKINDSGYSAYQHVFGKNPPQMEDAVLECGGADLGVVSRQQTGELAQERSMTMRRIALITNVDGNELCTTPRNTARANCTLDNLSGFGDMERSQQKDQPALSGIRA